MIVYRCVSEMEIADLMGVSNYIYGPHGSNTFEYDRDTEYRHFFYFIDSAISFMDSQNTDRYYNKYSIVMAYNIDDDMLKEHRGLGIYNLQCVDDKYKDTLLRYFKTIYYPEFAIPKDKISIKNVVGVGTRKRLTPVSNIYVSELSEIITSNEEQFLKYIKWCFDNGTDVKMDAVLEFMNILFPLEKQKDKR